MASIKLAYEEQVPVCRLQDQISVRDPEVLCVVFIQFTSHAATWSLSNVENNLVLFTRLSCRSDSQLICRPRLLSAAAAGKKKEQKHIWVSEACVCTQINTKLDEDADVSKTVWSSEQPVKSSPLSPVDFMRARSNIQGSTELMLWLQRSQREHLLITAPAEELLVRCDNGAVKQPLL